MSCFVAVPAYYVCRHLAVLYSVCGAAAASAFTLEECFCQFTLALSTPWACVLGLGSTLVPLSGPLGVTLYYVRLIVALLLATLGPVPALSLLTDELPRDPHTMAA